MGDEEAKRRRVVVSGGGGGGQFRGIDPRENKCKRKCTRILHRQNCFTVKNAFHINCKLLF